MEINKKVRGYLKELGITFNLAGYCYILDSMNYIYDNPSVLHKSVVSVLYPAIAAKHGKKPNCIERCIRQAITAALNNLSPKILDKYFSGAVSYKTGNVTNSQFLACLYTKLLEDMKSEQEWLSSEVDTTISKARAAAKSLEQTMDMLERE